MLYIANAFSLNMLVHKQALVKVEPISIKEVGFWLAAEHVESAVGHESTVNVINAALEAAGYDECTIECNNSSIQIGPAEKVIVAQYKGPRLEEGTKVLPEGATIEWYMVKVLD